MKRLFLLRHAKSSWSDAGLADIDRPLNDRGRAAAKRVGRWMRDESLTFDRVVASPARRIAETIALVEKGYGAKLGARLDPAVYLASSEALADIVCSTGDEVHSLLLIGHNPGLHMLAQKLAKKGERKLLEALGENLPTGALAEIAFDAKSWRDAQSGRLVRFVRPRDLSD